jgi:hypothetical protein
MLIDELMNGTDYDRPDELFCLDCHASLSCDDALDLEPSVLKPWLDSTYEADRVRAEAHHA